MSDLVSLERMPQRIRHMSLTHNTFEGIGTVFAGGNDVLGHMGKAKG